MANKVACTNCELVVATDALVGWIETREIMGYGSVLGVTPPDGQFCTEACLIKWFRDRAPASGGIVDRGQAYIVRES